MPGIESDLWTLLTSDPILSGLISTRLFPNKIPPHESPSPWVYYTHGSEEPDQRAGTNGSAKCEIEFEIFAETYAAARDVKLAIRSVLNGYQGGHIARALWIGADSAEVDGGHLITERYAIRGSTATVLATPGGNARIVTGTGRIDLFPNGAGVSIWVSSDGVLHGDGSGLDNVEASGTAAGLMATHLAAADPHPQYTTAAELASAFTSPTITTPILAGVIAVGGSGDLGISRNAAGVLEINNGTAGTLRDLRLRNIVTTGNVDLGQANGGPLYLSVYTVTNAGVRIDTGGSTARVRSFNNQGLTLGNSLGTSNDNVLNIFLRSDATISWIDVGLRRSSAGVVELHNASTGGATLRSVPLTPAQITADQNNYSPGVAFSYRLSSNAARSITGLSISQVNGQWGRLHNIGSFNITLNNESASSTATNRWLSVTGADVVLAPNETAEFEYDSTTSRYRLWKV